MMEEEVRKPAIFAIRTTVGEERNAADIVMTHAKKLNLPILAALAPSGIRGYVFIESPDKTAVERAGAGVKHIRGMVSGELPLSELEPFLVSRSVVAGMEAGDVIELLSGPFRGDRARIVHVDKEKEEVTVELFEATVPIPVTVRGDSIRVIQKKEKEMEGKG